MGPGGWKQFGTRKEGRALLMALAISTLVASLFYLGPYVAIAVLLVFGAALPIYLGWKRPRQLAIAAFAVLLVSAPIFSAAYAGELRVPSPAASSNPAFPFGNGAPAVHDARVTPFDGNPGGVYNFSATVDPKNLPPSESARFLELFISDCPGATGNRSPSCPAGYAFYVLNHTFLQTPGAAVTVTYSQALPGTDVWWWNLALAISNASAPKAYTWVWLFVNGGYTGVQGPVSGNYLATTEFILPAAYEVIFIYPGIVFYIGLLIYVLLKNREANRGRSRVALPPDLPTSGPVPPTSSATPRSPSGLAERTCPNCGAVVYPNESTCWKCGKSLAQNAPASAPPLESSKSP
ncbi:MAG: zinc ribbon domain-containing protein [Thermoplasmata archaeon]|nr:zinc ribbon domain-containing protein [Thermoplasmata archaeon]MCI4358980.1 zinc ribbon domain-containing protein [Thermoplasmata archaeon]